MSGFETLAMASSVLQVISFAIETAVTGKAIYDGTATGDSRIDDKAASMATASATMMRYTDSLDLKNQEEIDLKNIAIDCNETVRKLKIGVDKIDRPAAKGSVRKTISATVQFRWRRSTLQKLEAKLKDQKDTMELQILVRLLKNNDVLQALQTEHLDTTSTALQNLASEFVSGRRNLQDFVARGNAQLSKQIAAESTRLETSLKQHVTDKTKEALNVTFSKFQRQTIRSSTKYPGMNERMNNISEPSTSTYHWILQRELGIPLKHYESPDAGNSPSSAKSWPSFVEWAESDYQSRWYWISGNPGSGKSTLFKFLSGHEETQRLLSYWRPDVRVLRHFFWKPGNKMQKSATGFWCSLAHQLLTDDDIITDQILASSCERQQKSEHHDWSEAELRNLCFSVFSKGNLAYCIFVDGIDEVSDSDGAESLLKALDDIQSILRDQIKICVSSRLEYRFSRRIKLSWQLKLHVLTYEDLSKHTWEHLDTFWINKEDSCPENIITIGQLLIEKAEGVFLWLVLALEDIERGLRNEDSWKEIISRTEHLPPGIEDLYRDMWNRLNKDELVYRESARTMFHYMITREHFMGEISIMPLEIAFALKLASALDILEGKRSLNRDDLDRLRVEIHRTINLRSAGLLKINGGSHLGFRYPVPRNLDKGHDIYNETVGFVHRTAYDYLTTTEHGQSITGYIDSSSGAAALLVLRSFLAHSRCLQSLEPGDSWKTFHELSPTTWLPLMSAAMEDKDPQVVQSATSLLTLCSSLYESSVKISGESVKHPPLASYLIRYLSLSAFAFARSEGFEITRIFSWSLCIRGLRRPFSTLELPPENMQKCIELGLQKELRVIQPANSKTVRGRLYQNLTIFENLALRLVDCGFDLDFETLEIAEYLSLLQPSAEDMNSMVPIKRFIRLKYWFEDESSGRISRGMEDIVSRYSYYRDFPKSCETSSRLTPPKGRFWAEDSLELHIIAEVNFSYVISKLFHRLNRFNTQNHIILREDPFLLKLVEIQKRSVAPSAKILYITGKPAGDAQSLPKDQGGDFAFRCNFDSEGHKTLLEDLGFADQSVIDRIQQFMKQPARIDDMVPIDGYLQRHFGQERPWFRLIFDDETEDEKVEWNNHPGHIFGPQSDQESPSSEPDKVEDKG